jgi:hypothetical protein
MGLFFMNGMENSIVGMDQLLYLRVINVKENIIFMVFNILKKNGKKKSETEQDYLGTKILQ